MRDSSDGTLQTVQALGVSPGDPPRLAVEVQASTEQMQKYGFSLVQGHAHLSLLSPFDSPCKYPLTSLRNSQSQNRVLPKREFHDAGSVTHEFNHSLKKNIKTDLKAIALHDLWEEMVQEHGYGKCLGS